MRISELIGKLHAMRQDHSEDDEDIKIEVRNSVGEFDDAETVFATHYGPPPGPYKWKVFIDV